MSTYLCQHFNNVNLLDIYRFISFTHYVSVNFVCQWKTKIKNQNVQSWTEDVSWYNWCVYV